MIENNNSALIAVSISSAKRTLIDYQINELKELSITLGYKVQEIFIQNRIKIDPTTYIGKGKANDIIKKCKMLKIHNLIFNDELTSSQIKNIQKITS